jgi:hypothetical protein
MDDDDMVLPQVRKNAAELGITSWRGLEKGKIAT